MVKPLDVNEHVDLDCGIELTRAGSDSYVLRELESGDTIALTRMDTETILELME